MQTFMPYPTFADSARCLDRLRLGKQRVEAKQLLLALGVAVGDHKPNPESHWRNHPAAKMWRGHERQLAEYAHAVCREWISRGYKDSLAPQFASVAADAWAAPMPEWMGDEAFHRSHQSNLLRKDAEFYGQFGWRVPDDLPYVWPV